MVNKALEGEMKERGILFSTELIPKIMDGAKTQTRRAWGLERINKKPDNWRVGSMDIAGHIIWVASHIDRSVAPKLKCPYGQVGDRLWVRETFFIDECRGDDTYGHDGPVVFYRATDFSLAAENSDSIKWRPSIHMPRWASRIDLEITEVRAERLQDISPHKLSTTNLEREGLPWKNRFGKDFTTELERYVLLEEFKELWDSLNAKRGYRWDSNPWVWVIGFRRL